MRGSILSAATGLAAALSAVLVLAAASANPISAADDSRAIDRFDALITIGTASTRRSTT